MNILIVEDHPVFQDTLLKIIGDCFPTSAAKCAADGASAIRSLQEQVYTHLLLDLQIADIDGFDVADVAMKFSPGIRIIALTSRCDDYAVYRAEKRHIVGFVDKRVSTRHNFHEAIAKAEADLTYYSPSFQRIRTERIKDTLSFDKILSDREIEILALLAVPYSDREIASELELSVGTVEKHRFNILRKLNLSTTTELMRFARVRGIVRSATIDPQRDMCLLGRNRSGGTAL